MSTTDFTTTITVNKSAQEAFDAINNVAAWWQGEIKGNSKKLNDEFDYRFPDVHYSRQRVVEMIPGKKVVWLVTDSNLSSFKDKDEWTGTKIHFDITEHDGKTKVKFTHAGLTPKFQCYDDCSGAWGDLVEKSLYSLIMTGKGVKVFG